MIYEHLNIFKKFVRAIVRKNSIIKNIFKVVVRKKQISGKKVFL